MADQGASQRRANGSEGSTIGQTSGLSPRSISGESYVNTFSLAFTNTDNGFSSVAKKNILSPSGAAANETSPNFGTSYFTSSLAYTITELSPSSARRNRQTNIARIGNTVNEVISDLGISYLDSRTSLLGITPIITRYLLACYDTNGIRHYWLGFNISLTAAPLLAPGITFTNTLVVLGSF